jgi:hypothetical protein
MLVTGHRSPSAGYRPQLARSARHADVAPSGLAWAEPFTDSGSLLAQSIVPDGQWIADYS